MTEPDIVDFALDEDFEAFTDARGDMATVSGREAFEQEMRVRVSTRYYDIVGESDKETVENLLQLEAGRVRDEMAELVSVADIVIEFPTDSVNTVEVTIIYDTGDLSEFSVEG